MSNIISLPAFYDEQEAKRASNVRMKLEASIEATHETVGDAIVGYALVVWGKDGEMHTAYLADEGPISAALMPTLAADALNRHVAVAMAQNLMAQEEGPETA